MGRRNRISDSVTAEDADELAFAGCLGHLFACVCGLPGRRRIMFETSSAASARRCVRSVRAFVEHRGIVYRRVGRAKWERWLDWRDASQDGESPKAGVSC